MRSLETGNIVVLGLEEMGCFSRANVKIDESTCISLLTLNALRFRPRNPPHITTKKIPVLFEERFKNCQKSKLPRPFAKASQCSRPTLAFITPVTPCWLSHESRTPPPVLLTMTWATSVTTAVNWLENNSTAETTRSRLKLHPLRAS